VVFAVWFCLVLIVVLSLVVGEKNKKKIGNWKRKEKMVSHPIQPSSSTSYLLLIFPLSPSL
jgi:hypothetical protein